MNFTPSIGGRQRKQTVHFFRARPVEATEDGFDVRDKAVQTVAKNSSNARDELMTRFFGLPLGEARDKDWLDHLQAAKTLLAAGNASKQPGHYLGVAWRFWKMAAIDDAIAVAEDGLAHCAGATELHLSALKNNVAYFMAHRGLPADSERATSLAQEAYLARITTRHLGSALATRGYVAITYGKSRSEILTGIRDCTEGLLNGASLDLFFVHARRAEERAAELQEQAA